MVGIWTLPLVSRSCSSTGGNPRLIAWVTEVHQLVEYGHTSGCEWDLLEWHNTDMRPKTTHLVLKVSSVLRCCLWTNRLTLNQVYPIPAYVSYFCSMKQRYTLQVRWAQACLLQQNLLSPVQNQQEIYFMPGKWKPWLKYGQIHLSSLKSETKTGKKSVTGIKDAVQLSLVCTFCVTLEVRETVYTYPWDDKWRLNETIHVEFHLYPEHMLLWNVHRISIPNSWGKKRPHLKLLWSGEHGGAAAAWLWADFPWQCQRVKKPRQRFSFSAVCFHPGCGLAPVLTAVPALEGGTHSLWCLAWEGSEQQSPISFWDSWTSWSFQSILNYSNVHRQEMTV